MTETQVDRPDGSPSPLSSVRWTRSASARDIVASFGSGLAPIGVASGRRRVELVNAHVFGVVALIFVFPNLLFAASLGFIPGAIVAAGALTSAFVVVRAPSRDRGAALLATPIDAAAFGVGSVVAVALCLVSGEGHFFFAAADWLTRDAVLADIVRDGLPVIYRDQARDYFLRAPLGMYMAPAAVGWGFGLKAAHVALLVQNSFLLACCLYLATCLTRAAKLPFIACFVAFSGMDIVPCVFMALEESTRTGGFVLQPQIMLWNSFFSYWGHIPQIFWVPNHALPAWWFALLVLLHERGEIDIATLAASFAALLFWSPLAMMGAAPFLVMCAVRGGWRDWLAPRSLLAALGALGLVPVALYLVFDSGAVPHAWLIGKDGFLGPLRSSHRDRNSAIRGRGGGMEQDRPTLSKREHIGDRTLVPHSSLRDWRRQRLRDAGLDRSAVHSRV